MRAVFGSKRSARVTAETLSAAARLHLGTSSGELRWEAGPARIVWVHLAGHPEANSMLEGRGLAAAWGALRRARGSRTAKVSGAHHWGSNDVP